MSQLKSILAILSPAERRRAYGLLSLMIIGMVVETLGIGLVVPAIALFMQDDIGATYPKLLPLLHRLGTPNKTQLIMGGMVGLVSLYFLKALFLGYLSWRQNKFNTEVMVNLSRRLFTSYLRQPYSFHLQRNSAQLIRNIVNEIGYFLSTGLTAVMILITESLVLIGIVILLFVMEPIGALGLIVTTGLAGFTFQHLTKLRITRWGHTRQNHDGRRIQQVQQALGGVKDVLLLGREEDFLNQYDIHNKAQAQASLKLAVLQSMPRLWLEVMAVTGLATLVILMIVQGRGVSEIIPVVALFGAAAFRLLPSVGKIIGSIQSARFGSSVLGMLQSELGLEVPDNLSTKNGDPMSGDIKLCNVTFTYSSAAVAALKGLSLVIHQGETVAFIGPSGSGKSSLVDVILGLLHPDSGKIMVGSQLIADNLRAWQDQIGYVPQSIFLTDDTLRRNIAFGLHEDRIDDAAVQRSLASAQLSEFVETLPEGLETMVGERGIRLSGGQRQRIGIARALYHNPSILVLDEATSALDTETESGVMDAIDALKGSKTVIIVAHRLSTVENCDRIFRLEAGQLMETGTPAEILRNIDGTSRKAQPDLGLTA